MRWKHQGLPAEEATTKVTVLTGIGSAVAVILSAHVQALNSCSYVAPGVVFWEMEA